MIEKVPDGWRVEKVKNIVKIKKGKKVDIFEEYENGLFNYIDISVLRTKKYKYTNDNQIMATDKDILIVWDGANSGYSSFGLNGAVGSTLAKLTLNDKKILHTYFGKFIFSKFDYLSATSYGATIPHLQRQMLENISVPIPSLPQQEKIVKVLDLSSGLIEKQKELIKKYDLFLKSKFIEMFGDPISNPMNWTMLKISDLAKEIKYGSNEKSAEKIEGSTPVLRIPNIGDRCLNYDDMKYSVLSKKEYEKLKLEKGDLLFVRTNGNPKYIGKCISFDEDFDCVYASYLIRVKLKNQQILSKFIEFILSMPTYRQLVLKEAKTTAGNYNMNTQSIKNFKIINPPVEQQNKFASIVEKVQQIKEQGNKKLEHLETLHNSLMDKAFKGEIE